MNLTDREREVMRHLATGMPSKLIARQMGVSLYTVKTHIANVRRKAAPGTNRVQLALVAAAA